MYNNIWVFPYTIKDVRSIQWKPKRHSIEKTYSKESSCDPWLNFNLIFIAQVIFVTSHYVPIEIIRPPILSRIDSATH